MNASQSSLMVTDAVRRACAVAYSLHTVKRLTPNPAIVLNASDASLIWSGDSIDAVSTPKLSLRAFSFSASVFASAFVPKYCWRRLPVWLRFAGMFRRYACAPSSHRGFSFVSFDILAWRPNRLTEPKTKQGKTYRC